MGEHLRSASHNETAPRTSTGTHMRRIAHPEEPWLSLAAVALGVIGLLLGQFVHWVPALIAAVAAIVVGILALRRRERLRPAAIAGIVIGAGVVLFYAITIAIIVYHYGQLISLMR